MEKILRLESNKFMIEELRVSHRLQHRRNSKRSCQANQLCRERLKTYDTWIMVSRAFSSSDGDAARSAGTGEDAEEDAKERVRRKRDDF